MLYSNDGEWLLKREYGSDPHCRYIVVIIIWLDQSVFDMRLCEEPVEGGPGDVLAHGNEAIIHR